MLIRNLNSKGQRRHRRAAAAVEFAMILPLFLSLVVGTVEMGRAYEVSQLMHIAVRDAARMGSSKFPKVVVNNQKMKDSIKNYLIAGGVPVVGLVVEIKHATTGADFDITDPANSLELYRVSAKLPFNQANYITPIFMKNRDLNAFIVMRARPRYAGEQ